MKNEISELRNQIVKLQARNMRVEEDKAWEISWTRKILITVITYVIALWWMYSIGVSKAHLNALIPTGGYLLSTLSIPWIKRWWILKRNK
jgi:hypothetical protein